MVARMDFFKGEQIEKFGFSKFEKFDFLKIQNSIIEMLRRVVDLLGNEARHRLDIALPVVPGRDHRVPHLPQLSLQPLSLLVSLRRSFDAARMPRSLCHAAARAIAMF